MTVENQFIFFIVLFSVMLFFFFTFFFLLCLHSKAIVLAICLSGGEEGVELNGVGADLCFANSSGLHTISKQKIKEEGGVIVESERAGG